MTLLIDVGACCDAHTDSTLEHLHKAIGEGDDDALFNPHHSPFISKLIELFTQRGLLRLDGFRNELTQWLAGERHVEGYKLPRPGMMDRWTDSEIKLVKLYLEAFPPGEFTLDDYMLCVDMLVQKYLPADALRTEAEWLATRSVLMGRVQANMANLTTKQADMLLETLPTTVAAAESEFPFTPIQRAVLEYANAAGAENIVNLREGARHAIKTIIRLKMAAQTLGTDRPLNRLQTELFDYFGDLNRDWRRIALTEVAENSNQGYIASLSPGTYVRRQERYKGACPFCRKIDGRVMEVVPPGMADKDGETQIWVGKTNIGRSAAPRRRVAGVLIERQPDEKFWVAAGVQHVNCRGTWLPEITDLPGEDPEFGKWLRETLRNK
jgi:hypothetical protein